MRKLIFLGEGSFGPALLASTVSITGIEPDEDTFALDGSNPQQVRQAVDSICNAVHRKDSLVILCDFSMSKAMEEAWLVLEKRSMIHRMILISGANVPCAAAAMTFKEEIADDAQYARSILSEGKSGISVLGTAVHATN
ncbi:hypothetical protein [Allobaculum mucilyticum]|uniref:hypothetical protein n=1 Tax=Allobaculum mucilyticum TaxID=2834459 RepID=UPI001E446D45|nr:hypothetical protein [Allobaculum mucilyticum]UNT95096.1 hypothetical protein KWG62_06890 [Allobaculum mucilyticum]